MPISQPFAGISSEETLAQVKALLETLIVKTDANNIVALDSTSLTALETITANTGGLTDAQLRASALNVTVSNQASNITGYATETTLAQVKTALDAIAGNTDTVEALQTAANATLTNLAAYNDSVETLLTALGGNTDGLEALLNTLGVQTDQVEPLLTAIEAKTPDLVNGALPVTDANLLALQEVTQSVKDLSDTMLYFVSAMLDKMPRLDSNDRMIAYVESGVIQTVNSVVAVTAMTNLNNLNNFAGGNTALMPYQMGASYIYPNIIVS